LILEKISMASAIEVDELDSTERGSGGFGSTGIAVGGSDDASKKPKL
jgi:dUTPase